MYRRSPRSTSSRAVILVVAFLFLSLIILQLYHVNKSWQKNVDWRSVDGTNVLANDIRTVDQTLDVLQMLVDTENTAERHRVWKEVLRPSIKIQLELVQGDEHEGRDLIRPEKPNEEDYRLWYAKQVAYCGPLCSFNPSKHNKMDVLNAETLKQAFIATPIKCTHFFTKRAELLYDGAPLEWPPPKEIVLRDKYAPNNIPVHSYYLAQKYAGLEAYTARWTKTLIDEQMALLKIGKLDIS
jgi:hypothetical protein